MFAVLATIIHRLHQYNASMKSSISV